MSTSKSLRSQICSLRKSSQKVSAVKSETPRSDTSPYAGFINSIAIADTEVVERFACLGQLRGAFRKVSTWPWLALPPGQSDMWRELAQANACGLFRDQDGHCWALRFLPKRSDGSGYIFAIGAESIRARKADAKKLDRIASGVLINRHSEQLLWAIHAEVLRRQSSVVTLPDIALGQVLYGGGRSKWPKNWRQTVMKALHSLTFLRAEVFEIKSQRQPQLKRSSLCLAEVELIDDASRRGEVCDRDCPLIGQPHDHIRVQIGMGFLGTLGSCATGDTEGTSFDFFGKGVAQSIISDLRRQGRITNVVLTAMVLGEAKSVELTAAHCKVLNGWINERTRYPKRQSRAQSKINDAAIGENWCRAGRNLDCPFLKPDCAYAVFGGNGSRSGQGYRLVGETGRGWLCKCGLIPVSDDPEHWRASICHFLRLARALEDRFQFVVAAVDPSMRSKWYTREELEKIAEMRKGWQRIDELHVRVYAPSDFLNSIRRHLERKCGFTTIPGDGQAIVRAGDQRFDLKLQLASRGVPHSRVASWLDVSRSYVSQALNGTKKFSNRQRKVITQYLNRLPSSLKRPPR